MLSSIEPGTEIVIESQWDTQPSQSLSHRWKLFTGKSSKMAVSSAEAEIEKGKLQSRSNTASKEDGGTGMGMVTSGTPKEEQRSKTHGKAPLCNLYCGQSADAAAGSEIAAHDSAQAGKGQENRNDSQREQSLPPSNGKPFRQSRCQEEEQRSYGDTDGEAPAQTAINSAVSSLWPLRTKFLGSQTHGGDPNPRCACNDGKESYRRNELHETQAVCADFLDEEGVKADPHEPHEQIRPCEEQGSPEYGLFFHWRTPSVLHYMEQAVGSCHGAMAEK